MINVQDARNSILRQLRLRNYKCFYDQTLDFNFFSLLSGLNGTGKSSMIQALLLLRQSYEQDLLQTNGLALNGDLVHVGTAKDALFEDAKDNMIGFDLVLGDESIRGAWYFDYNEEADVLRLTPGESADSASSPDTERIFRISSLFGNNFHYLDAERIGSRRFFETSDFLVRQRKQLGSAGEFTAQFLDTYRDENITSEVLGHPDAVSFKLKDQVEAWLGEVSPNTRINLSPNVKTDTISLH